jgi:hypothetical protein
VLAFKELSHPFVFSVPAIKAGKWDTLDPAQDTFEQTFWIEHSLVMVSVVRVAHGDSPSSNIPYKVNYLEVESSNLV